MSRKSRTATANAAVAREQAAKARKNRLIALIAAAVAVVALCIGGVAWFNHVPEPVASHWVEIQVQDYGTITAELYGNVAPITVENFTNLVADGFYDGLTFHRIIDGFMIQGGDPNGDGTGGSEKEIKGEFSSNGVKNPILHDRGVLSMARSNDPNSASSQFFIMHENSPHLDGQYAAFGRVLTGIEIVDAICQNTPVTDNKGTVLKENQPIITSIRMIDKPAAPAE